MRSRCSPRSEASFTIAVSGVRSSCATSAVKRRSRACASESAVIFASSASAISLKDVAQRPNSSELSTGRRVSSRPSAREWAAVLARLTGASVRRARSAPARPATTTTIPSPTSRIVPQVGEVVPELLLGEEEVRLVALAARNLPAGDEVARVGDLRALVGELAVGHELLEVVGDLPSPSERLDG